MYIVKREKGAVLSLPSVEMKGHHAKVISSRLAQSILHNLCIEPSYPSKIAKDLKVHGQKVYYHIRNMERAGIVKKCKEDIKSGVLVNYYALASPSFFVKFDDFKQTQKLIEMNEDYRRFLDPFIVDGKLDSLIIVGSPNPHGPLKARARDINVGIELALFFGTFLNHTPTSNVKLDIDVKSSDLLGNLILIGGPRVNRVIDQINDKLPIYFDEKSSYSLRSTISGKLYSESECGMVVKIKNPFNKSKSVMVIGGKGSHGTRASILAFLKGFDELVKGNRNNPKKMARVVEGIDCDSDGNIDSIEFKE
ncbi:MAG: helix-turn-helix domain-containing protein [Candidatus Woesearchaeota archaeon]